MITECKEALSILRGSVSSKQPFNQILTDFQMPEMNGFDLAREIKTIESLKGISIIVLSSAGRKGDGKICTDIGIEGYLTNLLDGMIYVRPLSLFWASP